MVCCVEEEGGSSGYIDGDVLRGFVFREGGGYGATGGDAAAAPNGLSVFHFSLLELQVEVCDAFKEAGPHSLQNAYAWQAMRLP